MKKNIYSGLLTALITPFKDGKIDKQTLETLIEFQVASGVNGLVIGGSTGEGSSLSESDYYDLIKTANEFIAKRVPITAGITAVSTEQALPKLKKLEELGVDGVMLTEPYYIRPEQEGLLQHFKTLHDNSNLPIISYFNPSRTGVRFADESILKLAECERIIAIKDAGADIDRPLRLSNKLPAYFNMLTGDDGNSVAYSAHGGRGCISVTANILPVECTQLQVYLSDGDYASALKLQQKLLPVYQALFMESNPIGIKYAAYFKGLCSSEIKPPLTMAREKTREAIEQALGGF